MRRFTRLVAVAAATAAPALALVAPQVTAVTPAAASEKIVDSVRLNGFEAKLLADINEARRAHGIRALAVVPGATDVARAWAWHLATAQALSHNPSLVQDMSRHGSAAWTQLAENVGEGPAANPDALFQAYMASPPHRANILDGGSRFVGVGVVQRGDTAWNTLDFTNAYSSQYGRTRIPPAGLTMDQQDVTASTDLASLESPDERFGTAAQGAVHATQAQFSGPSPDNDRVVAGMSRHGSYGDAELFMRSPLQLSHASTLLLQLSSYNSLHRALTVTVQLRHSFVGSVTIGTLHVGGRQAWYSLPLPANARSYCDSVVLRVGSRALGSVGGWSRLSVLDVRATV